MKSDIRFVSNLNRWRLGGFMTPLALCFACHVSLAEPAAADVGASASGEAQVTTSEIIDLEFDQAQSRFTYSDRSGNLWIGTVDSTGSKFKPANGRGMLVANDAAFMADFGNGPEWSYGAAGKRIVYTAYVEGLPKLPENARIASAVVVNNAWQRTLIDSVGAWASPLASLNPKDASPRITYQSAVQERDYHPFYWRRLDGTDTDHLVPRSEGSVGSRRWVPGTHNLVFSAKFTLSSGIEQTQAFLYNTDTDMLEQLTFDDGDKGAVFMWQAPEYGNEMVFFTMVNRDTIRVYRKISGVWTISNTIVAGSPLKNIWSPEPFVYNGKSYIFMTVSPSPVVLDLTVPTHVAISDIANPGIRLLTKPNVDVRRVRSDPEVFITTAGPYLYYNSYVPQTPISGAVQDGVWRVDTGLGPAAGR